MNKSSQSSPQALSIKVSQATPCRRRTIGIFSDFLPRYDASSSNLRSFEIVSGLIRAGYTVRYFWWLSTDEDEAYLKVFNKSFDKSIEFIRINMEAVEIANAVFRYGLSQVWLTNLWGTDWMNCVTKATLAVKKMNSDIPVIADTMDYHAKKYFRKFEQMGDDADRILAEAFFDAEKALYNVVDGIITISASEARDIAHSFVTNKPLWVIGNIHTPTQISIGFDERDGFVFLGNYRVSHNVDAVRWFLDRISPLLRDRLPDARLFLAGKHAEELPEDIAKHSAVSVVGYVEDMDAHLSRYRCMVAPLTYGAGLKGKIGSAAACGLPVVTSSIGAEGYHFVDGKHAFVADDPALFAERCACLHEDKGVWETLSTNITKMLAHSFSGRKAIVTLLDLADGFEAGRTPSPAVFAGVSLCRSLPEFAKVMDIGNRKKRIAVIEPTLSHQETFHSLIEYSKALGFGVDFILRNADRVSRDILDTFTEVPGLDAAFFQILTPDTVDKCVAALNRAGHKAIFFNTLYEYWLQDGLLDAPDWEKLHTPKLYAYMHHRTKRFASMVSHPNVPQSHIFTLGDSMSRESGTPLLIPSHFYGAKVAERKVGPIRMICVGGTGDQRRNYSQLLDACILLNEQGLGSNYRVDIVGGDYTPNGSWTGKYRKNLRRYGLEENIILHGEQPFRQLFRLVSDSDYMLFLIDMDNPYSGEYLHDKITGSLNLSLGFAVVPILDKRLADNWGLAGCAVAHDGYRGFLDAIQAAVRGTVPYWELQRALQEKNDRLKTISIDNFKSLLMNE